MQNYFGIGIYENKTPYNLGTLWRTADIMGAAFIFTIGLRYKHHPADVTHAYKSIPLFRYNTIDVFLNARPYDCQLVGIEMTSKSQKLKDFSHPNRAIYLLGSEDNGIPNVLLKECQHIVQLPGERSMNVSVAGSIVMYDRVSKS